METETEYTTGNEGDWKRDVKGRKLGVEKSEKTRIICDIPELDNMVVLLGKIKEKVKTRITQIENDPAILYVVWNSQPTEQETNHVHECWTGEIKHFVEPENEEEIPCGGGQS